MKPRILIAETDATLREHWVDALEHARFEVEQAQSPRESLYRFCIQTPDLMILSLSGPAPSGLATIDLMRNFNPNCPMVIVADEPEHYAAISRAGMDRVLKKPVDGPGLLTTVKGLVRPAPQQQSELGVEVIPEELPPTRKRRSSGGRHYSKHAPLFPRANLQRC
jgi:DNA-binding response OmpR family regulator